MSQDDTQEKTQVLPLNWKRCGPDTFRASIPSGWLVYNAYGMAFVPDPSHSWDATITP